MRHQQQWLFLFYFIFCGLVHGPLSYIHPELKIKVFIDLLLEEPLRWPQFCEILNKEGITDMSALIFDDLHKESEFLNLPRTLLKHHLTPSHIIQLLRGPLGKDLFPAKIDIQDYESSYRRHIAFLWTRLEMLPASLGDYLGDSLIQMIPPPFYSLLHPRIPLNSPFFDDSIQGYMHLFLLYPQSLPPTNPCHHRAKHSLLMIDDLGSYCLRIVRLVVILSDLIEKCPHFRQTVGKRLSLLLQNH